MRRADKGLSDQETKDLLVQGDYGILSTVGPDGQPYGVPLNYVYKNDGIYFHCATIGQKLDNISAEKRVSFCVVGNVQVLPKEFSTRYESAIVFGPAQEISGNERFDALIWLLEKYSPDFLETGREYIKKHDKATKVIKITIEQLNGKAA
ncbi:pyridoxamine 5'-phosphate oxidase family protein [Desulfopila sp. IMCC35008]|uniref:pyridoxamine 5'-phosphate oxidase family protein n=1 Tax=Desulfopila sp. IMCC35008 TaxID=2653858 RepID=UPI0013D8DB04|nr:pyridoxamine 5'-phosphate oxidase family protein [Desulfopila sp. IMCC35008]